MLFYKLDVIEQRLNISNLFCFVFFFRGTGSNVRFSGDRRIYSCDDWRNWYLNQSLQSAIDATTRSWRSDFVKKQQRIKIVSCFLSLEPPPDLDKGKVDLSMPSFFSSQPGQSSSPSNFSWTNNDILCVFFLSRFVRSNSRRIKKNNNRFFSLSPRSFFFLLHKKKQNK